VADDDYASAIILVQLLRRAGYEAQYGLTAEAVLQVADEFDPDVVFVDLIMPDMSGYELAQRIRSCKNGARPKIVSLTGMPRGHGHGDDSIFDEYLLKPASLTTLRAVIDAL